MKQYCFHWELKNLIIQFMKALDDCVIKRYDENRDPQDPSIAVKLVYSPKTRTIQNLVNKQQNLELPVVSVSLGGISRDSKRVFNKIDGPTFIDQDLTSPLQPVPVDISINVSILTKYQNDMDQIISNMIPYFDPYIIISWKHPDMTQEIRSKVTWNGNLSYQYPNDIQATTSYRQSVDTTFTMQGWLFKKAEDNVGIIHTVITDFIGVKDWSEVGKEYYDSVQYDRQIVSGIPIIQNVKPMYIKKNIPNTIYFSGNMLDLADHVYLSGSMSAYATGEYIDAFSEHHRLSADNPPFYGTEIFTYDTIGNVMILELPAISQTGMLDVIVLNQAGYGGIIKNANTHNLWRCGIIVYGDTNVIDDNMVFVSTDIDSPAFDLVYEQLSPLTFTTNPSKYTYYLPIYTSEPPSASATLSYSQTESGSLYAFDGTTENVNKYLKVDVSGMYYFLPIYRDVDREIIIGDSGLQITGEIVEYTDTLDSAGYLGFNYNDSVAYIPAYLPL